MLRQAPGEGQRQFLGQQAFQATASRAGQYDIYKITITTTIQYMYICKCICVCPSSMTVNEWHIFRLCRAFQGALRRHFEAEALRSCEELLGA